MTASVDEAVDTLYKIVDSEPYKSTSSWTNTRVFALTDMLQVSDRPFVLDTRLNYSDHSNGTGHI